MNFLQIVNCIIAIVFGVITVLAIWHGYKITIGEGFSFEQYPLKRFFIKE